MSWDIFSNSSDDSGEGGALSAIEGIVGVAGNVANTYIAANSSTPIYGSGPLGTFGSGSAAIAQAKQPSSSILLLGVFAVVAIFAYKSL